MLIAFVVGCGGGEADAGCNATQPECGRWCGGGTESVTTPCSPVTCTTNCGKALIHARFLPVAECDKAKADWLAALAACGH